MVQKAVEMGVSKLVPVITRHTKAERVNVERMRANAIEAAEQCGILNLPEIAEPVAFDTALAALEPERTAGVLRRGCAAGRTTDASSAADATDQAMDICRCRSRSRPDQAPDNGPAIAVMIGPEGGFSEDERQRCSWRGRTRVRLSLGPRILRADTAAVAALALVQAALGDWRQ